jgi:ribosomal protein S18 acetylase RimI-like enzyme
VTVRPIAPADRAALARLLRSIAEFKPEEVEVAEELIALSINDAGGSGYTTQVAVDGAGALCGYICYGPTPMTASTYDLYWIAVDPELQGQGIGRALYAAFVAQLAQRGGAQIRIETSSQESYAKTGGFYEKLGFSVDGRLNDFYAPGDDLLIFYRRL